MWRSRIPSTTTNKKAHSNNHSISKNSIKNKTLTFVLASFFRFLNLLMAIFQILDCNYGGGQPLRVKEVVGGGWWWLTKKKEFFILNPIPKIIYQSTYFSIIPHVKTHSSFLLLIPTIIPIPSNKPSAKFPAQEKRYGISPKNLETLETNTSFTIRSQPDSHFI